MVETPPNPEDGELWLPSDVFLEIVSTDFDSASGNESTIASNSCHRDAFPITKPVHASPETQIRDSLLHTKPNVKAPIGDGFSRFDHERKKGGLKAACGPFDSKSSNPSTPVQDYKHKMSLSEGTGVFLPRVFLPRNRIIKPRNKECSGRRTGGTGTGE